MASESSSRTPFTMDCTQVASAFTLNWAEIRANSSFCFTGLLHDNTSHDQQSVVLQCKQKLVSAPCLLDLIGTRKATVSNRVSLSLTAHVRSSP